MTRRKREQSYAMSQLNRPSLTAKSFQEKADARIVAEKEKELAQRLMPQRHAETGVEGLDRIVHKIETQEYYGDDALKRFGQRGLVVVRKVIREDTEKGDESSQRSGKIQSQIRVKSFQPVPYGDYDLVALQAVRDPSTFENLLLTADWGFPHSYELRHDIQLGDTPVANQGAVPGSFTRFPPVGTTLNFPTDRIEVTNEGTVVPGGNNDLYLMVDDNVDVMDATRQRHGFVIGAGENRVIPQRISRFITYAFFEGGGPPVQTAGKVRISLYSWQRFTGQQTFGYSHDVIKPFLGRPRQNII